MMQLGTAGARVRLFGAVAVVLLAATSACSSEPDIQGTAAVSSANTPDWPFETDSGTLRCRAGHVVTFETGGKEYGVNAEALSAHYPNSNQVTKSVTMPSGRHVAAVHNTVLAAGLKLCR